MYDGACRIAIHINFKTAKLAKSARSVFAAKFYIASPHVRHKILKFHPLNLAEFQNLIIKTLSSGQNF